MKVELLELLLPFKEYLESKVLYEERKQKRQDLHAKTVALAEKNKPVHDFKAYVRSGGIPFTSP